MNSKRKRAINGFLNRRVDIERPVQVSDGGGGFTETWQIFATVWAGFEVLRGSESFSDLRVQGTSNHRITVRYTKGVEPKMRVVFNHRIFNIRAVINIDEANEILELMCEEGVAV